MNALSRFLHAEFRPLSYLALPTAGIDISTSGIKAVVLTEKMHGLEMKRCGELILPQGAVVGGEIADRKAVVEGLRALAKKHHLSIANVGLPEARGYLFEAEIPANATRDQARVAIEQRLEEYVPLPASEVVFDFIRLPGTNGKGRAVGMGYARRVIEETLSVVEEAGLTVRAIESETFALPRAILQDNKKETVLIIDIGKTTTKLMVATDHIPRYVTTLDIGGHALTLAVMKYFNVSEEEAKRVKMERGINPDKENEEYLAAMVSAVSVIRDEVLMRLEYWQSHATQQGRPQVTRAILVAGNSTVLGLPEYLEASLKIPVQLGDVFVNLASPKTWHPPITRTQSLAYGTAIGLALREYVT